MAEPRTGIVESNLNEPHQTSGLPNTGTEAITSEAGGVGHDNHPDPAALGLDGTGWVALATAVFIAILLWQKVPRMITAGLDRQIAAIRARLDEAKAIRAEAEALRDDYARRLASVETEIAGMLGAAETESKAILAKAATDAEALVGRRTRMAEDKIAAAERAALDQVRARTAMAAAAAAEQLIRDRMDEGTDRALVDRAIAGLGRAH